MMGSSTIAPTPPYKALVFDCDGTLADTLPVQFQTWFAALKAVGAEISRDWYYQDCGTSAEEMLQILKITFGYDFDTTAVIVERQQHYQTLNSTIKEVTAVADLVRHHYSKVSMAVASGGERSVLEATLKTIKLRPFFNTIVSIDDVEKGKPEPDIFLLASQRLNVAPQDCIVYEDTETGLEAARRAGMRAIDVRSVARSL